MEPTFDHVGPMAATVKDVALLLEVIAGSDEGRDPRQIADLKVPRYSQLVSRISVRFSSIGTSAVSLY